MQEDNGNHQEQVKELIKETADSLDNLALKMLLVSVQQNNLELCIKYAVQQWVLCTNSFNSAKPQVSTNVSGASCEKVCKCHNKVMAGKVTCVEDGQVLHALVLPFICESL